MHVETCQNRDRTGYNRLAAIAGGIRLIHKSPLLFELPSYVAVLLARSQKLREPPQICCT
jgi:hypothetical protein